MSRRKRPTEPRPTLDDAAALLIQATAEDAAEVARAAEALAIAARDMQDAQRPGAPMLAGAAQQLANAAKGRSPAQLENALTEAAITVEAVMALNAQSAADMRAPARTSGPSGDAPSGIAASSNASPGEIAGSDGDTHPHPAGDLASRDVVPSDDDASADDPADAVLAVPPDVDAELLDGFVAESIEYLDAAQSALLVMESDPEDAESCNTVFRAFHTIKGTSAFLGLDAVTAAAHVAESLLSRIRDREIAFGTAQAEASLGAVDLLRALVQTTGTLRAGGRAPLPATHAATLASLRAAEHAAVDGAEAGGPPSASARMAGKGGSGERGDAADSARIASSVDAWMRVRTERVDRLVDMIGELVIAQSMLAQDPIVVGGEQDELARKVTHAGKIVRELQDLSMAMRMVPLRPTFQKMARLVRDVAHRTGKQVELVTAGEETEVDRNMVDLIADPLVHMIRNAVDHGIEDTAARVAAGKPAQGTVELTAYHAGGNVIIELHDDGRGLYRERIAERAVERGIIESDKGLSDSDVYNLIFAPGFSTAESVTAISGRGVGMDVVRRNVEALRGRIDIVTEPGRGTRFTIRLPLTLAITDGMLVQVGAERYIVPTVHIELSLRPAADQLASIAGRGEIVRLRDDLLPIVRLHRLFELDSAEQDPTRALLVVVCSGSQRCALLVDDLVAQQQVVAKPLGTGIGRVPGVSGSAILGDGRVGLILDVAQIIELSATRGADRANWRAA